MLVSLLSIPYPIGVFKQDDYILTEALAPQPSNLISDKGHYYHYYSDTIPWFRVLLISTHSFDEISKLDSIELGYLDENSFTIALEITILVPSLNRYLTFGLRTGQTHMGYVIVRHDWGPPAITFSHDKAFDEGMQVLSELVPRNLSPNVRGYLDSLMQTNVDEHPFVFRLLSEMRASSDWEMHHLIEQIMNTTSSSLALDKVIVSLANDVSANSPMYQITDDDLTTMYNAGAQKFILNSGNFNAHPCTLATDNSTEAFMSFEECEHPSPSLEYELITFFVKLLGSYDMVDLRVFWIRKTNSYTIEHFKRIATWNTELSDFPKIEPEDEYQVLMDHMDILLSQYVRDYVPVHVVSNGIIRCIKHPSGILEIAWVSEDGIPGPVCVVDPKHSFQTTYETILAM